MHYQMTEQPGAWGRGGTAVAMLVATEIGLAWAMTLQPRHTGVGTVLTAAALAIGSVIVVARCRMPALAKATLILAGAATFLTWIATQDALGLKGVKAATASPLDDAAAHADDRVHVRLAAGASAVDPHLAAEVQSAIDARLAEADVTVAVTLASAAAGDRSYRLAWSLERGEDRRWCGDVIGTDAAAADLGLLADRVAAAARRSHGGPLACA